MADIRLFLGLCGIMSTCLCLTTLPRIHVHPTKHWFLDEAGRVRIFHGINTVNKGPPWYPKQLLNQTRLDELKSWGFNAVRLGMMWTGTEPQEGRYDYSYIRIIRNITEELQKRGIYVILDMHQDALARPLALYDGVPPWLLESFPPPEHPYPWPLENYTSWDFYSYFTEAVGHAFQCLYDNYKGAADKMANFWKFVASEFSNQTSVLGYELINEPWVGDWTKDVELFLPGHAGKKNVVPLHDRVSKAIRTVDNETMIFYESVTWGYIFSGEGVWGSGYDHVPGGKSYQNRSVLSYHYYCWIFEASPHTNVNPYNQVICDKFLLPNSFSAVQKDLDMLGGGAFLTEFGRLKPNVSEPTLAGTIECNQVLKEADSLLQSWAYWGTSPGNHSFWDATGRAIPERVAMFARTYARAVSGIPTAMTFDVYTHHFQLIFIPNANIKEPTEIFVPRMHYEKGYTVMASTELECRVDKNDHSLLYVNVTTKATNDVRAFLSRTSNVTVTIVPSYNSNVTDIDNTLESICLKVNW